MYDSQSVTNHDTIVFYHGTSSHFCGLILEQGLKDPYLTNCFEQAGYYADCCADDTESEPVILEVTIEYASTNLITDIQSLCEPVMANYSEKEIWELADSATHELGITDWRKIPWHIGLNITGAVHYQGLVLPSRIKQLSF